MGRPKLDPSEKKKAISIKLPPWLIDWLDDQDLSRSAKIEQMARFHCGAMPPEDYDLEIEQDGE